MKSVLGLGNALVDILATLPNDELLSTYSLPKGSMQLVNKETASVILKGLDKIGYTKVSGGSAANTLNGVARLGLNAGFIGKVGKDELGTFFHNDQKNSGISPLLLTGKEATGRATVFISPDAERTFATYLGAAIELTPDELTDEMFEGYDYFHIEGYIVQNHELIKRALQIASSKDIITSLDLASYNVVEENLDFLREIISQYVDIVFANEEEAKTFTGMEPLKAVYELAKHCKIAIVKTGKEGSLIVSDNNLYTVPAITVNAIDATGAGDLYAAGFIYGLSQGLTFDKCGSIGSLCAGNVVEVIGPKMDDNRWKMIHENIQTIIRK